MTKYINKIAQSVKTHIPFFYLFLSFIVYIFLLVCILVCNLLAFLSPENALEFVSNLMLTTDAKIISANWNRHLMVAYNLRRNEYIKIETRYPMALRRSPMAHCPSWNVAKRSHKWPLEDYYSTANDIFRQLIEFSFSSLGGGGILSFFTICLWNKSWPYL